MANSCKKSLVTLLVIILTFSAFYVLATADGPDYWQVHGVASDDVLNIRSEANAKAEKIGEIPPDGQCIKNLKCIGGLTMEEFTTLPETEKEKIKKERPRWCYIEYKGVKGWVAGRYLREGACLIESR
ncbi:SH3 domain-containing protein [Kaarinaea lacus]